MKFITQLLIPVICLPILWGQETMPLQAFGEKGSLAPTFLGHPLSPEFFTKSQMAALADGRNYVTTWQRPMATLEKNGPNWQLFLANLGERDANMMLSAEKGNTIRNFVVPIPQGEEIGLDLSPGMAFDQLYLISSEPFSAVARSVQAETQPVFIDLAVREPDQLSDELYMEKSSGRCSSQLFRPIQLAGYDYQLQTWQFVNAFADRTNFGQGTDYHLNVHYPTYGSIFHQGVSITSLGQCGDLFHYTYAAATGKTLKWTDMYRLLDGFIDETHATDGSSIYGTWIVTRN